jgi:hypothetical protein
MMIDLLVNYIVVDLDDEDDGRDQNVIIHFDVEEEDDVQLELYSLMKMFQVQMAHVEQMVEYLLDVYLMLMLLVVVLELTLIKKLFFEI